MNTDTTPAQIHDISEMTSFLALTPYGWGKSAKSAAAAIAAAKSQSPRGARLSAKKIAVFRIHPETTVDSIDGFSFTYPIGCRPIRLTDAPALPAPLGTKPEPSEQRDGFAAARAIATPTGKIRRNAPLLISRIDHPASAALTASAGHCPAADSGLHTVRRGETHCSKCGAR